MNMVMTFNDAKGALYLIIFLLLVWFGYNSEHSDNEKLQTVTSFWLGSMIFMVLFYIIFSTNK